jgi:hypothetical protein
MNEQMGFAHLFIMAFTLLRVPRFPSPVSETQNFNLFAGLMPTCNDLKMGTGKPA